MKKAKSKTDKISRLIIKGLNSERLMKIGNRTYQNLFKYPCKDGLHCPEELLEVDIDDLLRHSEKRLAYVSAPSDTIFMHPRYPGRIWDKTGLGGIRGGLTDASTVTQAALNALTSGRTWKEQVILKGNFLLSGELELPSFTRLDILGKLEVSSDINAIRITGAEANRKSMVEINGGEILSTVASTKHGIYVSYADWVTMDRVDVRNFSVGIQMEYCYLGNSLLRSRLQSNIDTNLKLLQTNACNVLASLFTAQTAVNGFNMMIMAKSGMNNIKGNIIESNVGVGIYIGNSHDNLIQGNYIERNDSSGVYESYDTGSEFWTGGNGIKDNYFDSNDESNERSQLYLYKSLKDKVVGNSFLNGMNYVYSQGAIRLESGAEDTIIELNRHDAGTGTMAFISDVGTRTKCRKNPTYVTENSGTATFNGTGAQTVFTIAHDCTSAPTNVNLEAKTADASGVKYWSADGTNITVTFITAPPAGTNNVVIGWKGEV